MNAPATARACPKCGTSVAAETKFCPNCGNAVSGIFSGGGSPMDGTAMLGVEQVDTLVPILQDATLGDYDIYGELGRGGMAAVYLALDLSLNRKVAIKTMLPDLVGKTGMVDRFKREAQTAAALSHPHIIQIFSVKQTKNLVYFVMKYIEGRSLESVIIERGKLDVDLTRVILSQVGGALAFAHRKGVVHRDMKPANIMLEEDGWAIVTDFGIAKVQEAQNLTATGTAIGTPHYMSPEQFHNKAVTGASDQYSLGIVAYEMLTGKKPFDGATYAEIITQHLFESPPDIRTVRPDIPANVADAIMRMMAKEASARFPDLDAAVTALGTPTTTQGEKARTQIISIAKSNQDERKARMSVPKSPVPAQRKAPDPTVVEKAQPRPAAAKPARPRPEVREKKSHVGMAVAVVLLILVGVGGTLGYLKYAASNTVPDAAVSQSGNTTTPPVAAPTVDSTRMVAEQAQRDSIAKAVTDSITAANAAAAAAAAKQLDAKNKAAATRGTNVASRESKTQSTPPKTGAEANLSARDTKVVATDKPATQAPQPAPEPSKPVVAADGYIVIGTRTPSAVLFINGAPRAEGLKSYETIAVKPGEVKIAIRADKCTPFEVTVTVTPKDTITIGRKALTCE
jgi:serine/threonine protein kinase